ncbi:MAG: M20/M25/M40 family metallo-hydrolase [Tepidanaerobacteraceae bacterium]|nr:M20/M25/M40 family metallo-hydrolase [Tepidanaerobacteraceae bacterium]
MEKYSKVIKSLALDLAKIPSIVGTVGEIDIANKVYERLSVLEYFKKNQQNLKLVDVKNDSLGRKYVLATIKPENKVSDTVLLLGHIDTVGIEDYGDLKNFATEPKSLKKRLKDKKFSSEIEEDIDSDNWIFGRGIFDMKMGVAALMTMVEEFSKRRHEIQANLVFIAVPDEEGNSVGMLSAVRDLAAMSEAVGWQFIAAIDTDYMTGLYAGDDKKYVYIGTVGKLLPCFYVYGKETHVGEAFHGFDANLLASEIMKQVDLNHELCDIADGEVTLPPISLYQRDLKTEYSVQTVNAVNIYFNYATHISPPDKVIEKLKEKAVQAFDNTIQKLDQGYKKFCEMSGIPYNRLPWQTKVLTFEELYRRVRAEKPDIEQRVNRMVEQMLEQNIDDREFTLRIVQEVHRHYSDKSPLVVLYYAPPYYPHNFVKGESERERRLLSAVEAAVKDAKKVYDYTIVVKKFYPYISDLSYCNIPQGEKSLSKLIKNMPAWSKKYSLPVEAIQKISMPVVNIGPYGKDAHKLTERVSISYSLDAMPLILKNTIENLVISNQVF